MKELFYHLREQYGAVILDEEDSKSVIYKGLKFVMEDDEVFVLSSEIDMYQEVEEDVYRALKKDLEYGVDLYRVKRNKRALRLMQKGTKPYSNLKETIKQLETKLHENQNRI